MGRRLRNVAFVLLATSGCGAIIGIKELDSDERPDSGPPAVVDAGQDAGTADVVDAGPSIDAGEADKGFRRVFVTSQRWSGKQVGGLVGADSKCMDAANANGLRTNGEEWFAWLSAADKDASERLTFDGSYRLLNGTEIANDKTKLTSGSLFHAIDVNEKMSAPEGSNDDKRVWTGTDMNGNRANHCLSWQDDFSQLGTFGRTYLSGKEWTADNFTSCSATLRLYCIEK